MAIQPSEFLHAPTGGTLVPGGATFRVWAPRANAVHVSGDFNGWTHDGSSRMAPIGGGHWAGFVPGLKDGDRYLFFVEGTGSSGFKRDPRGAAADPPAVISGVQFGVAQHRIVFPGTKRGSSRRHSTISSSTSFDVGTFSITPGNGDGKIPRRDPARALSRLASGVNALALLPIQEFPTMFSMG